MGIPDVSALESSSAFQLKGEGAGPLPPVLQQYVSFKEDFPEYLLLSQTGGFYEVELVTGQRTPKVETG